MYKTMQEIEREYDGNFVCMINCKKNEFHGIEGGEVIAFGKDKFEIQDIWAKSNGGFYRYFGDFPDMAGGFLL